MTLPPNQEPKVSGPQPRPRPRLVQWSDVDRFHGLADLCPKWRVRIPPLCGYRDPPRGAVAECPTVSPSPRRHHRGPGHRRTRMNHKREEMSHPYQPSCSTGSPPCLIVEHSGVTLPTWHPPTRPPPPPGRRGAGRPRDSVRGGGRCGAGAGDHGRGGGGGRLRRRGPRHLRGWATPGAVPPPPGEGGG